MKERALSGLRVLEFGNLVSVPYCGKLMADLGAEVIKVESPVIGDEARRREPYRDDKPGVERSGLFAYLNTNKLSVTLNPETSKGKGIFMELIKGTDILLENHPPGWMEEQGLDYKTLERVNPMLIMTSITPFGQTGPYRDYKAHELTTYHGGGYGFISTATFREPVRPPVKGGGRQSQFGAALVGAVASMCAVFARELIGAGQHVDVSILECMAGQYEAYIQRWTFLKEETGGLTHPIVQPILPLPCKDGWIFLMCVQDHEFDKLVEVMGNPEWAQIELFENRFTRADHMDALAILLEEWSRQYTKAEIFQMCRAARVPVGPGYTPDEVVNSEHLNFRAYFVDMDHPEIGPTRYPGAPYRFSETPWKIEQRAPILGEHNQEIFHGRLGYSKEDLVKLAQMGVI